MNALSLISDFTSTVLSLVFNVVAQAKPDAAPKPNDKPIEEPPMLEWWQWILILVLVGLIVFYVIYKKKQNQG